MTIVNSAKVNIGVHVSFQIMIFSAYVSRSGFTGPCCFVQLLSCILLFVTPWTATHQTSLSFTISWSLLKLMSTESVIPFKHLILCRPLLLMPPIFPSIRVFSNKSALCIRIHVEKILLLILLVCLLLLSCFSCVQLCATP